MGDVDVKTGSQCSCLRAAITRVDAGLSASVSSAEAPLRAAITRVDAGLSASVSSAEAPLRAAITRVDAGLSARISMICAPNTDIYLRIEPEMLWFANQGDSLDVNVISNIRWTVK